MKKLSYSTIKHKKKASTMFSLATGELLAAEVLVEKEMYREAVIHIYFCAYYLAQSVLMDVLKSNSHKLVAMEFNKRYGKGQSFIPKTYVEFYNKIHVARNNNNYNDTVVPKKSMVIASLFHLHRLYSVIDKNLEKVTTLDIIKDIYISNPGIVKDFSYDIYCPKTYSHHNRISYWQPPFYIDVFSPEKLCKELKETLRRLRVRNNKEYVLGLNSKVNQYESNHYLMLDFDSMDTDVESELKEYGGVLLKSGRGFHFIGNNIIIGEKEWIKILRHIEKKKELKGKIDRDHIEISIKRGYSTLRITSSKIKPNIPIFYKQIG